MNSAQNDCRREARARAFVRVPICCSHDTTLVCTHLGSANDARNGFGVHRVQRKQHAAKERRQQREPDDDDARAVNDDDPTTDDRANQRPAANLSTAWHT